MQKQDKIPYLAAISLFMSALEMFIPKPIPFFRLGLANIPLLLALDMDIGSFMLLALMKGLGTSYVSGNLFSIFGLMSISQSVISAFAMYAVSRLFGKHISIYGISITGALSSASMQILIASLYAGKGMFMFFTPLLLISFPASIITAFASSHIRIPDRISIEKDSEDGKSGIAIAAMLISGLSVMMLRSPIPAAISFAAALAFQKSTGRKIRLLPHIIMLAVMVMSSAITPEGKVLFSVFSFPVTEGALIRGMTSSLRLSAALALSQGFYKCIKPSRGIIGETIIIFSALIGRWEYTKGSISERIEETLMLNNAIKTENNAINIPNFTIILITVILIFVLVCDYLFF